MNILKTVAAAFSMFSAIPVPGIRWEERNMRYLLCAFPLVGMVIGILSIGWQELCAAAGLPAMLRGLGMTLLPVWVTGGIHLDGFCDTWDALSSHLPPEEKRSILKDPHLGVFAAIHLGCLLLATFVFWTVLPEFRPVPVLLGFVLSRALSALAVASFPLHEGGGLVRAFAEASDRGRVRRFSAILSAASGFGMCLTGGMGMVLAAVAVFLWFRFVLLRQFGGLSGDLSGWFLQEAELWMLVALYAQEVI